jgi:hypothetical protein
MIEEGVINDWYEEMQGGIEEEILNCGYTYRDIENAKDALIALTSAIQEEAQKSLSHFKKSKLAPLFYLVGKLDGSKEGFQRAIGLVRMYKAIKPMTEKISRETL